MSVRREVEPAIANSLMVGTEMNDHLIGKCISAPILILGADRVDLYYRLYFVLKRRSSRFGATKMIPLLFARLLATNVARSSDPASMPLT